MKEFGHFIDNGRAYCINTPNPPRRLINVLYNTEGYLTELTHWGTGTVSFQFDDGETNTVVCGDNKTIYCRDEEKGDVWCPGVYPMMSDVDGFICEHHDAFSIISSTYHQLRVSWRVFVPVTGTAEVWSVTLQNMSDEVKHISVVPAVKLQLTGFSAPRFCEGQDQTSWCDYRQDLNGMYFYAWNPWMKHKRYNAFLCTSGEVSGYTGNEGDLLGAPLSFHYPLALLSGKKLENKKRVGGQPFQALQCKIEIPAGETAVIDFIFGIAESVEEAKACAKRIRSREAVEALFEETCNAIRKRRENLIISTPDKKLDAFVNTWLKKGMEYCLRKKDATRDNLQFADGLTMTTPERVRGELLKILRYQYSDGHTVRSWVPMDETYYCDGPLWIVLTTCGYLKYSDDMDFLNVEIPYFDKGTGTVLEHLERCIVRIDEDRGPHQLPLARYADWNDALNLPDPGAESVFMAMAFGYMLKEMAHLMKYLGKHEKENEYEKKHTELKKIINEVAWDKKGGYYVRAFSNGEVIGGADSKGSKIYVNPQSWAILGDIVPEERLPLILDAVDRYIDTPLGCMVNYPAYESYDRRYGRISAQMPGTIENGSVYCHVTSFKSAAEAKIGLGDRALKSILKILPDSPDNPAIHSGATPFALTSSYSTNPAVWGEAGRPWLTGTQGWVMRTVVEGLLGIRRAYGGFKIKPSLPSAWNEAQCTIRRMGAEYQFMFKRDVGKNTNEYRVRLNGEVLTTGFIPFQAEGLHKVEID